MLTHFVSVKPKSDGKGSQPVSQLVNNGYQLLGQEQLERPKKRKTVPALEDW